MNLGVLHFPRGFLSGRLPNRGGAVGNPQNARKRPPKPPIWRKKGLETTQKTCHFAQKVQKEKTLQPFCHGRIIYITACDTGPVGRQLNQKGALAALGRALRARPWGGDLSRILNVQYISKVLGFARVPKPSLNVPGEWDSGPSNKGNLGLGSATFSKCMWIFLMCHNGYFSLSKRARRQSW